MTRSRWSNSRTVSSGGGDESAVRIVHNGGHAGQRGHCGRTTPVRVRRLWITHGRSRMMLAGCRGWFVTLAVCRYMTMWR